MTHACLQPSKAFMDAPRNTLRAEIEYVHAIPAHLGGNNDLVSREVLQCSAKHLQQHVGCYWGP